MIHSLSGGVIAENGEYTFAKVEIGGAPYWYLAEERVEEGDVVLVPFGGAKTPTEGRVLRTERCSRQCAPVPMNRIKTIIGIVHRKE